MQIPIKQIIFSFMIVFFLVGCGSSDTSLDSSSMSMNTDASLGGDGDMGSLMGGGGLDMSLLFGDDDDGGDDSSSSSTVTPPPNYEDKGDVFITYNGKEIFFKAIATQDDTITVSNYQEKEDLSSPDAKSYTITISGYDTHGNSVHLESGFLAFTFTMQDPTVTGWYDLETPQNSSGRVSITYAKFLSDHSTLHMKGRLIDAEIYNMEQNTTFNISVDFDVDLLQVAPLEE
jgi:hypothetical protein